MDSYIYCFVFSISMTSFLRDDIGYLNSRHYAMSLIRYPNGSYKTNDIDFVSFENERFLFGECKQFVNGKNEIWIDYTKFNMLKLLAKKIEQTSRKIFLVGTDSYDLTRPTDTLRQTTLDDVLRGETPYQTCSGNIIIQKEDMIPFDRQAFSELGNQLLKNPWKSITFAHLR